jgi:hypothetical protein
LTFTAHVATRSPFKLFPGAVHKPPYLGIRRTDAGRTDRRAREARPKKSATARSMRRL